MEKSPKIYTHVDQIFLYKVGLLLNIHVTVPFFFFFFVGFQPQQGANQEHIAGLVQDCSNSSIGSNGVTEV